ncbi:MAG: lipoprotein-releasing ABC transporter permease subunit [Vicinamibacterales bacterium]|jgi:lipoprotein-releasing system permease protein|nr:lipoprotein-releasing system transmembrane subunit LolC [Acidobacteriota bacterium]MDP7671300.1 lipoprotein-releasing ABC transporter permease subunit [Vicinamibacterales bacterium]HJO38866.1 lipoprotein-releasing ABC transporter permease subunit [Vicinamibacterales bacterium]
MRLPFELYVALRYLLARRRQAFISLISVISTIGVAVGVMALLIALALMTGLQQELRDRIVGSTAHVYVWKLGEAGLVEYDGEIDRLREIPRVIGVAPVILGQALVTSGTGEAFITIKGIDSALEADVTEVGAAIRSGSLDALEPQAAGAPEGLVIGDGLAAELGAFVGDEVTLMTPQGRLSPMGVMPRTRRFRVVGIFDMGLHEFDTAYAYVRLDVAARLLDRSGADFLELKVDDVYAAPDVASWIMREMGTNYLTQDWSDLNRSLFSALWLEKMAISITVGLIVAVAALNIVASLVLLVMDKSRDIAILKTMGTSARSIMVIFMLQGLIIGLVGTAIGAIGGVAATQILDRYQLVQLPSDVYQVTYVPFTLEPLDLALVLASAVVVCFVATIYPSRQASSLDPAQALRYQ